MNAQAEKKKIQKSKHKQDAFNTETMLDISEIRWDTLILKDHWIRWIIKASWLNLDLRNYEEQEVVVEQYKKFLNWLDFPIQIMVRNNYLDLSDYITYLKNNVSKIENDVLKWQWENYIKFIEEIDSKQGLIYVKEFYIIVPFYDWEQDKEVRKVWWKRLLDSFWNKQSAEKIVEWRRLFLKNKKFLDTRCSIVIEWLKWLGMFAERLETEEIISTLFKYYNPWIHKNQSELTN